MSGEQEPWVFRGGLVADLQVSITHFIIYHRLNPTNNLDNWVDIFLKEKNLI